jgi:hypothetical protein
VLDHTGSGRTAIVTLCDLDGEHRYDPPLDLLISPDGTELWRCLLESSH